MDMFGFMKDPEKAVREICEQRGMDVNEFMDKVRALMNNTQF